MSDSETPKRPAAGLGRVAQASLDGEQVSARGVLDAIGGVRGIAETFVPATVYLVTFILTRDARVSAIAPVVLAVAAFAWRLIRRESIQMALSGLLGVLICAGVTLFTGRGETYYLPGFWINGAWVVAHTVSLIVGWPLLGFVLGFFRGSITGWRQDRGLRRAAAVCTLFWIIMFAARLAVQLPLFFAAEAGDDAAVDALGLARLLMGVPLFALVILFTWLVLSRVSARTPTGSVAGDDAASAQGSREPLPSSDDLPGETQANTGENGPSA